MDRGQKYIQKNEIKKIRGSNLELAEMKNVFAEGILSMCPALVLF